MLTIIANTLITMIVIAPHGDGATSSPLKPRKMENNQTPSECKHYNNGACVAHNSAKCLNTLFSVRYGYQKPNCLDYEPKEKKDNDSRTTENN